MVKKFKVLFIFMVCAFALSACAKKHEGVDFSCYNVDFGDNEETVKSKTKKLKFITKTEDDSKTEGKFTLSYYGEFYEKESEYTYFFEENQLVALLISVKNDEDKNLETYNTITEGFTKLFGEPSDGHDYIKLYGWSTYWGDKIEVTYFDEYLEETKQTYKRVLVAFKDDSTLK